MKKIIILSVAIIIACLKTIAQSDSTCNAGFTFNFTGRSTVQFNPYVTGDSGHTSHSWSFGDGTTTTLPSPQHAYTGNGNYIVKHIITTGNWNDSLRCSDTVVKVINITSDTCNLVANFFSSPDSLNPFRIFFHNTSYPLEPSDSIIWTFGDGTSSSQVHPYHIYTQPGTYTVCLRIKKMNNNSTTPCVREICKTITILRQPPACNFQINFIWRKDSGNNKKIYFTNLTTSPTVSATATWTFGDGSSATSWNAVHEYKHPGVYRACLKIRLNDSCIKEVCDTIVISQPACNFKVNFTWRKDSGNNNKIYFTNELTTVPNATATWTFGDGSSATSWNAVHEYKNPGVYRACLKIRFNNDCIREKCDSVIIVVPNPAPPCNQLSNFKSEKNSTDNQQYKFIPAYLNNNLQYTWTFGDGSGSHDPVAMHRYEKPGTYMVCLTVWNGRNCTITTCKEVRVIQQVNCDSIRLTYSYRRVPGTPKKVYFYANSSAPILDQVWKISKIPVDSTSLPVVLHQNNPAYAFRDTGYYKVCLKAIATGGCVKEYCNTVYIAQTDNNTCELQAYPNPASHSIKLNVVLTQPEMIHLYVYNSSNTFIKEKHQAGTIGNNNITISTSDLIAGIYNIKIVYGAKNCHARFQKL